MKLRLFFDEDVHAALAPALRKRGYDAVHVVELRRLLALLQKETAASMSGQLRFL